MRWILAIGFCLMSCFAAADEINVYVTYDDAQLQQKIKHFNQFLDDNGIFKKYHVRPFLELYPLHTTLYLTHYKPEQLNKVMDTVQVLSQSWPQFSVNTSAIYMTKSNYLMMDVEHKPNSDGLNPTLQEYSDNAVMTLYKMRDTTAPIPDWAKKIPSKLQAYRRYGSPNVFFELSPHFTLLATQFDDPQVEASFQAEMDTLLAEYEARYPNQVIALQATQVGIGRVNKFGQITEELAHYPLPKSMG